MEKECSPKSRLRHSHHFFLFNIVLQILASITNRTRGRGRGRHTDWKYKCLLTDDMIMYEENQVKGSIKEVFLLVN